MSSVDDDHNALVRMRARVITAALQIFAAREKERAELKAELERMPVPSGSYTAVTERNEQGQFMVRFDGDTPEWQAYRALKSKVDHANRWAPGTEEADQLLPLYIEAKLALNEMARGKLKKLSDFQFNNIANVEG